MTAEHDGSSGEVQAENSKEGAGKAAASPKDRRWLHGFLLVTTLLSTTAAGACHYQGFEGDLGSVDDVPFVFSKGLWFSLPVMAILGFHEMGHWYACRRRRVSASLPYFLPAPFLFGTLGAFIRIRERIGTKSALFDIGVAGPIAGFVVAVPVLFVGVALSRVVSIEDTVIAAVEAGPLLALGEPLLFRIASWTIWGTLGEGFVLSMHPTAFAGWVGLFATAVNLFPIGQLDGGHITYAVFGAWWSTVVTVVVTGFIASLVVVSPVWLAWIALLLFMFLSFGVRHPPTLDPDTGVDRPRLIVAACSLVILILCFTPAPIALVGSR